MPTHNTLQQQTRHPAQEQTPKLKTLVIHNADDVSFQQVWEVLGKAFAFPIQICRQIAMQAHREGTAEVYTGSAEIVQGKLAACDRACEAAGCPQLPFTVREA